MDRKRRTPDGGRGLRTIPHSRPYIDHDDIRAVKEALASEQLAQGKRVKEFERRVAVSLRQRGGVALSSGTAALHLALLGLGAGPGATVALPSFSCAALLHAIEYVGAKPLFVDIAEDSYNIDPADLGRKAGALSARPSAIVVPHMFGRVCDIGSIREAVGGEIPIIEDCAHAIGDSAVGDGDALVCSFYATKMITTGEGGMFLSRDPSILGGVRDLRDYDEKANHRVRYNYKMTDLEASLGLSQLKKLPMFLARRRELSERYGREERTCFRFVIPVADPADVIRRFERQRIRARRPVFMPLHRYLGLKDSGYPNTAHAMESFVSVPIYPALREPEVRRIVRAMQEILS